MNPPSASAQRPAGEVVGTGLVALDRIQVAPRGQILEELGGSCGNVLISLAMLGRTVTPLLRLGDDDVGGRLVSALATAGADTSLVTHSDLTRSPVILELLDPSAARHSFSSTCPETSERLGSYEPITLRDLDCARAALATCRIFYADRLSEAICAAMESAAEAGAIVHFEPSRATDELLFERAIAVAHLVKYSDERLPPAVATRLRPSAFGIVTAGELGLHVLHDGCVQPCPAQLAEHVIDTCGAGDMVTLGILDAIIAASIPRGTSLPVETVLAGARSGQTLAAANCAFVGARGFFRERGPAAARAILDAE